MIHHRSFPRWLWAVCLIAAIGVATHLIYRWNEGRRIRSDPQEFFRHHYTVEEYKDIDATRMSELAKMLDTPDGPQRLLALAQVAVHNELSADRLSKDLFQVQAHFESALTHVCISAPVLNWACEQAAFGTIPASNLGVKIVILHIGRNVVRYDGVQSPRVLSRENLENLVTGYRRLVTAATLLAGLILEVFGFYSETSSCAGDFLRLLAASPPKAESLASALSSVLARRDSLMESGPSFEYVLSCIRGERGEGARYSAVLGIRGTRLAAGKADLSLKLLEALTTSLEQALRLGWEELSGHIVNAICWFDVEEMIKPVGAFLLSETTPLKCKMSVLMTIKNIARGSWSRYHRYGETRVRLQQVIQTASNKFASNRSLAIAIEECLVALSSSE